MADSFDFTPAVIDLHTYAGGTASVQIDAPEAFAAGREWLGEVKATTDPTSPVLATFVLTDPGGSEDHPRWMTLPAAATRVLAESGVVVNRLDPRTGVTTQVAVFTGVYDIDCAPPGMDMDPSDPIVRGAITVEQDVSGVPA